MGFVVYRLNPLTGVVSEILRAGDQSFGGATVAVEFGDSIYFGTATGTSMGKIPK